MLKLNLLSKLFDHLFMCLLICLISTVLCCLCLLVCQCCTDSVLCHCADMLCMVFLITKTEAHSFIDYQLMLMPFEQK